MPKEYTSRLLLPSIPFILNGVEFKALPALPMAVRRAEAKANYEMLEIWGKIRAMIGVKQIEVATTGEGADAFDFDEMYDQLEVLQAEVTAKVLECMLMLIPAEFHDSFREEAGRTDDITLYEIYRDLRRQIIFNEEVLNEGHPTMP